MIAGHGWYHARLGHGVPWLPVAAAGFLGLLLALRRIPVVARALTAPGMVSRLELPHTFRVAEGTAFLLIMFLGHLPALFALPAGLGDIAAGIAAPLVARRLAQGTGRHAALWFTAFGMTDLVNALTLGALTGFALINVTPCAIRAPRADRAALTLRSSSCAVHRPRRSPAPLTLPRENRGENGSARALEDKGWTQAPSPWHRPGSVGIALVLRVVSSMRCRSGRAGR